ncbi:MAG: hypothetical protein HY293_19955 [Planctomycetes bacterium]|nr:hypothetical protein [Planctomycetota bacterium]
MRILPAAILLLSLQAPPLDDYYKFKTGTTWTWKRFEGGAERKITGEVTGTEEGKVKILWKDPDKDGTSNVTWSVVDGVLTVTARKETDAEGLTFSVLKADSKKDDKWFSPGGEVVHLGKVEVTVPAGTYKDVVRTQLKLEDSGDVKVDFYLAPNVGLVKVDIKPDNGNPNSFELAEFKEPKK